MTKLKRMVRIKLVPILHHFSFNTLIFLGAFLVFSNVKAQKTYFLQVRWPTKSQLKFIPNVKTSERNDSLYIIKVVNQVLFQFHSASYLLANVSDWRVSNDTILCSINPGEKMTWKGIQIRHIPDFERRRLKLPREPKNNEYNFAEITKLEKSLLGFYENNGYPFASLILDSLEIEENIVKASIRVQRGPLIVFDSLKIFGTSKMRPVFLSKYLRMNIGGLYTNSKVVNAEKLLRQLPYASFKKSPYVVFKNNKARVFFFLDEKRSNQADGIIGFAPNSGTSSSLLFTGEINLLLRNLFGRGINMKGGWRSFQGESQSLSVDLYYPNSLGSNIDTDFGIDFLKQDSTFRTFKYELKFSYQSNTLSRFSMFGGAKTSDLISTGRYKLATSLPPYSDFTYAFYGLGYVFNNLDDYFYPKSGWLISLDGTVGAKTIRKNAGINEIAYDNVNLNSTQFTINFSTEKYTRIYRNSIFYARLKGGKVSNVNILINDLYRFGGFKTIRGFNENEYFASDYLLGNFEFRQFIDPGSYIFLFFDQALYATAVTGAYKQDAPFGFGAGASLTTSAGVFNFAYGLGQSSEQKINFNLSKIHFGYISRF